MQRFSIGSRLLRRWMLLVAVFVVALAGLAVYRLHGIFGSKDVTSTPSGAANEIVPFNPKHVVMGYRFSTESDSEICAKQSELCTRGRFSFVSIFCES